VGLSGTASLARNLPKEPAIVARIGLIGLGAWVCLWPPSSFLLARVTGYNPSPEPC